MSTQQTIRVVEDSPEDYEATERGFRRAELESPLVHCETGDQALDYLYRRGECERRENGQPGVILLDLNLPGTDGREVLRLVKSHENLKMIPVIVLTTSSAERDIDECYRYGANSYIQKPVDLDGFRVSIQRLKDFWMDGAILPSSPRIERTP